MSSIPVVLLAAAVILSASMAFLTRTDAGQAVVPIAAAADAVASERQEFVNKYGKLPLSFAGNLGQADRRVRFMARGQVYNLFLTTYGAVLALEARPSSLAEKGIEPLRNAPKVLRMKLAERREVAGLGFEHRSGEVCQHKPIAYQEFNGARREVGGLVLDYCKLRERALVISSSTVGTVSISSCGTSS